MFVFYNLLNFQVQELRDQGLSERDGQTDEEGTGGDSTQLALALCLYIIYRDIQGPSRRPDILHRGISRALPTLLNTEPTL